MNIPDYVYELIQRAAIKMELEQESDPNSVPAEFESLITALVDILNSESEKVMREVKI